MDSDDFCYSILSRYPIIPTLHNDIGVFGILFGLLYVFNTGLTVYWIMHQRFNAELGVERAARHVTILLLPLSLSPIRPHSRLVVSGGVPCLRSLHVGISLL